MICGNKLGQEKAILDDAIYDLSTTSNKNKRPRTDSMAEDEIEDRNMISKKRTISIEEEEEEGEEGYRDLVEIFQERFLQSFLPTAQNRTLQKRRGRKPGPARSRGYSS